MNKQKTQVFKKGLSIFLSIATLVWSLGVPLGILFAPSAAQAAASVILSNGTVNGNFPGAPIGASSSATAIAKVSVTASAVSQTLTSVQVNFSGTGFATSDLLAIATGSTSGVALYNDAGGTAGSFDGTDAVVTLAASPAFAGSNITLTPATPVALTNAVAVVFYVVIKTSSTIANNDVIAATIPASGVMTTDGAGPTTPFPINEFHAHTGAPTIVSVTGVAGQNTVTVKFSEPVQKVGGGNLSFVGAGDPLTFVDLGTTGSSLLQQLRIPKARILQPLP